MTDSKYVKLLKRSGEEWNKWRDESPGVIPDLNKVDLECWFAQSGWLSMSFNVHTGNHDTIKKLSNHFFLQPRLVPLTRGTYHFIF